MTAVRRGNARTISRTALAVALGLATLAASACGNNPSRPRAGEAGDSLGGAAAADGGGKSAEEGGGSAEPAAGKGSSAAGASGATSATGGAAGAPTETDPCEGATAQGQCVSPQLARRCVVPTGDGMPTVISLTCRAFEHCQEASGNDPARCVLDDDKCIPNASECDGAKTLRTCNSVGAWADEECADSCRSSAAGAFCSPDIPTKAYAGSLEYEVFYANSGLTDWADESSFVPAEGVLVASLRGRELIDATLVEADGGFAVQVAATTSDTDRLVFLLLHPDASGATVEFGVFDPAVPSGVVDIDESKNGQVWQWEATVAGFPSGSSIQITENFGSGAIHIYNYLRAARELVTDFYGATPRTVAAWIHFDTEWSCGACFAPYPTEVQAYPFDTQLFFSATAEDRAYWSDPVIFHEIGHYAMWSYGTSPHEGGPHCLGVPTAPGQAWSEGWATGFSSIVRESPYYYDKRGGTMFWVALDARQYTGVPWRRPDAANGLLQDIDENEVAAMLWDLAAHPDVGAAATLAGLRTKHATVPQFTRGYTRRVWEVAQCERFNVRDTGESVPTFADYLDGLACGDVPLSAIDDVTQPSSNFPYPGDAECP